MATKLITSQGKITFLRVQEVGGKFGGQGDQIDVDVATKLSTHPDRAMGFKLRVDDNRLAHQGMLDLLRDAFASSSTVSLDYSIDLEAGKHNGTILRVTLLK
jgi:hypothetical protein